MTKSEIKALQRIIAGDSYQESIINKALLVADSLEVKVCLKGLKRGRGNHHAFMCLQDFVCRLSRALNNNASKLIAYKQLSEHNYVHVIHESKVNYSDDQRRVGVLTITDHAGSFEPELWNFLPEEMSEGVHLQENVNCQLLPNFGG